MLKPAVLRSRCVCGLLPFLLLPACRRAASMATTSKPAPRMSTPGPASLTAKSSRWDRKLCSAGRSTTALAGRDVAGLSVVGVVRAQHTLGISVRAGESRQGRPDCR